MDTATKVEAVNVPSMRGPVRVSDLSHPRLPRHKSKSSVAEQGASTHDPDGGDNNGVAQMPQGLAELEKHQLQNTPAEMRAQQRRNSTVSEEPSCHDLGQVSQTHASSTFTNVTNGKMASHDSQQSNADVSISPRNGIRPGNRQLSPAVASILSRRMFIRSLLEQKKAQEEKAQKDETVSASDATAQVDSADFKNGTTESAEMNIKRHSSLDIQSQGNVAFENPCDSVTTSAHQNQGSSTAQPRNSKKDLNFPVSHSSAMEINGLSESSATYSMSSGMPQHRYSSFNANGPSAFAASDTHKVDFEDPGFLKPPRVMPKTYNVDSMEVTATSTNTEFRKLRASFDRLESEPRKDASSDIKQEFKRRIEAPSSKVKDQECENITFADYIRRMDRKKNITSAGMSLEDEQHPCLWSSPQQEQKVCVSGFSVSDSKQKNRIAASVNYCKMQLRDKATNEIFPLTLVTSDLSKLLEICAVLTEKREAKMVKFGASTDDFVDEMSQQIGVPLTIAKLHNLPPGGHYSAEELLQLSTGPLSRQKPAGWDALVERFERECSEGILLRHEEVKCFEPSDHKLPDGTGFFRSRYVQDNGNRI